MAMANEVNIGNLDTLVMLRSVTKGRSADGYKTTVFEDFRQVYAQVERRVDEQVNTGNLEQGDFVQLTIYKVPELTTRWQVKIGASSYEITALDPIDRLSPYCILTIHALD